MSQEPPIQPNSEKPKPQKTPQQTPSPKPSFLGGILGVVRSLLPPAISQKLSDGMLAGAIAAIILIFLTLPLVLPSGKPAEIAAIEQPPPEEATLSLEEISEELPLEEIVEDSIQSEALHSIRSMKAGRLRVRDYQATGRAQSCESFDYPRERDPLCTSLSSELLYRRCVVADDCLGVRMQLSK